MTASYGSCDFIYVHTDIPEGMTIREWRARRAANRPTRHRWRFRARASAVMAWHAAARALARPMVARVRAWWPASGAGIRTSCSTPPGS